jgi:hypothetical protein
MIKEQQVLLKLQSLKTAVKENLRTKGVIVPVKTANGLKLDSYEVVLEVTGNAVYDKYQDRIYKNLHYLQTAVLVANSLALRRPVRDEWINDDKYAGVADFDKKLFEVRYNNSLKKKDLFGIHHYYTRLTESKIKHKTYMASLNNAYYRLLNGIKSVEKTNKYS